MSANEQFDNGEWTPDERALLASLSKNRIPSVALKQRTLDTLREHGAVEQRRFMSPKAMLALAAAASLIFAAGAIAGYAAAQRPTQPTVDAQAPAREAVAEASDETPNTQPARHVIWY